MENKCLKYKNKYIKYKNKYINSLNGGSDNWMDILSNGYEARLREESEVRLLEDSEAHLDEDSDEWYEVDVDKLDIEPTSWQELGRQAVQTAPVLFPNRELDIDIESNILKDSYNYLVSDKIENRKLIEPCTSIKYLILNETGSYGDVYISELNNVLKISKDVTRDEGDLIQEINNYEIIPLNIRNCVVQIYGTISYDEYIRGNLSKINRKGLIMERIYPISIQNIHLYKDRIIETINKLNIAGYYHNDLRFGPESLINIGHDIHDNVKMYDLGKFSRRGDEVKERRDTEFIETLMTYIQI
jgi:hypothetical protein